MDTQDIIGICLIVLGVAIFLITNFLLPRFKTSYGIKEYKKIREKFLPKEEEEPEDDEEEPTAFNSGDLVGVVTTLIVVAVGLSVSMTVLSGVSEVTTQSYNVSGNAITSVTSTINAFNSFGTVIPILVIGTVFFIIFGRSWR